MEIISDIIKSKDLIESLTEKYGYCAEHYYYCFLYNIEEWEDPRIFLFDDGAVLAKYDKDDNDWYVFVGVLAREENRERYLEEFLGYAFSKGARKVWVELESASRRKLLKHFKEHGRYKANKINYTLTWPVFEMKSWDGALMQGKDWKDMRYYWNKFLRDHKVEFKDASGCDKEELKKVVLDWKTQRTGTDITYTHYYIKAIEHGFVGYNTRIMVVDGKICAITAGYKCPGRDYYYSSIGVATREFDRTGEIANMDDLIELKKKGYGLVDFGGGEKALTEFKKKFKPAYYYKTHVFSIVPLQAEKKVIPSAITTN